MQYSLRIKLKSAAGLPTFIWVNILSAGRYVKQLGSRTDFYTQESPIKEWKGNPIVIAVYSHMNSIIIVEQVFPWVVNRSTGIGY